MKNAVPLLGVILSLVVISCSQEKKLVRKASNAVERSEFEEAIGYYDQALKKDSNSYYANAGKGIVLSEYMGRHQEAIPYLEKALKKNPEKTGMKLNNDLGQSYHFIGNYPRALYFYGEASKYNKLNSADYDMFLSKRVADCKYAMDHPEVAPPEEQSLANVGTTINTSMPEYGAVYTHNKLIFTSKRKDDDKEKKNGLDGRYFEGMYVSYVSNGNYSTPRRYTVPDTRGNQSFANPHESVVSVSPDNSTLYIYRAGQIYEADLNDSTKSAHKLNNDVNFSYLQSHATLSADGRLLVFAAEADKGVGGLDLYKSVKDEKGNWSKAQLLDNNVNTIYNEDAPFLAPNGTLFFASNGLPGYGGYDVYKTRFEDGVWATPKNLGQPINSPGDETYFMLNGNTSNGYYTSVRTGGYGDMDIYTVHYVDTEVPKCQGQDTLLAITADKDMSNEMVYTLAADVPNEYAAHVRSYSWQVNGAPVAQSNGRFQYTFNNPGSYTVTAKAVAYCDTCPTLIAFCSQKIMDVGTQVFANADSLNAVNTNTAGTLAKGKNKNNSKDAMAKNNNNKNNNDQLATSGGKNYSNGDNLALNDAQLSDLGWSKSQAYFDLNQSEIREDAKTVLNQDIDVLKKNKTLAVKINGYADSRGSEAYNKNLSQRRAQAVKSYLIENGISQRRILAVHGFGESQLVNGCTDDVDCSESEHQANRRVQFEVINLVKTPSEITLN